MSLEKNRLQIKYRKQAGNCPRTWIVEKNPKDNRLNIKKYSHNDYKQDIQLMLDEQKRYMQCMQHGAQYTPHVAFLHNSQEVIKLAH